MIRKSRNKDLPLICYAWRAGQSLIRMDVFHHMQDLGALVDIVPIISTTNVFFMKKRTMRTTQLVSICIYRYIRLYMFENDLTGYRNVPFRNTPFSFCLHMTPWKTCANISYQSSMHTTQHRNDSNNTCFPSLRESPRVLLARKQQRGIQLGSWGKQA